MDTTLVLGGTGKTGRRVAERLGALGVPVRIGSRSGEPPFDWEKSETWAPTLEGMSSAYISYYPDLAVPGAVDVMGSLADLAVKEGVSRLVLLAGRGEEEAERAEQAVRDSGADLTIVRATWFMQNFSEDYIVEYILAGEQGDGPRHPIRAGLDQRVRGRRLRATCSDRGRRVALVLVRRGPRRTQRPRDGRGPAGAGPGAAGLQRLRARSRCVRRVDTVTTEVTR
jgi:uncharacterized protein YbjT (DUF2867 family)